MTRDPLNRRIKTAMTFTAALLPFACLEGSAVLAQSIMRTPSLHIESRISTINPTVAPRVNPSIAGRTHMSVDGGGRTTSRVGGATSAMHAVSRIAVGSTLPYVRYSHNLYPVCEYAYRGPGGECFDRRVVTTDGGGGGGSAKNGNSGGPRGNNPQTAVNLRTVANELVAELDGALSDAQADEWARSHGLERIQSQDFPLVGGTIGLFRIVDRRPVETVSRELAASARSVQPNFRYVLQDQKAVPSEGDPAQYFACRRRIRLPMA